MGRTKGSYNESIAILGLSRGASLEDIKDAYRTLAKKYHPDINPADKGAKFREINRAYRYLQKHPNPTIETDYQASTSYSTTDFEARRSAYYRRKRKEKEHEKAQKAAMFKWLFSKVRILVFVILVFNTILAIDYFLPTVTEEVQVEKITIIKMPSRTGNSYRDQTYKLTFNNGMEFRHQADEIAKIDKGSTFLLKRTPIIQEAIQLTAQYNHDIVLTQAYGVFKVFGVCIPISILLILGYFYVVKNNDYRLTILLFVFIMFIIQLVLVF